MSVDNCYSCKVAEKKITELQDQIQDIRYGTVTAFLWGLLIGIIGYAAAIYGF